MSSVRCPCFIHITYKSDQLMLRLFQPHQADQMLDPQKEGANFY